MNLAELVTVVSATTDMSKPAVRKIIKSTLKTILTEVKKGGRVTLVGFGAFFSTNRDERVGRNPKTGDVVRIPPGRVPVFKAGKEFKSQVKKTKTSEDKKSKRSK